MKFRCIGHVQGTNATEWECPKCKAVLVGRDDAGRPKECEACGFTEHQEPKGVDHGGGEYQYAPDNR
jgi:predicted RNA-binding Zn-ribbon protein involved in translation (DUF1610 family)